MEIQSDAYGGGRPQWMRPSADARAMRHLGLHDDYGHLAAFELSASPPSALLGDGLRRNGYGTEVTASFDEDVEPGSIHARIAGRDLAESVVAAEPALLEDLLYGAAAYLAMERRVIDETLRGWRERGTALRTD